MDKGRRSREERRAERETGERRRVWRSGEERAEMRRKSGEGRQERGKRRGSGDFCTVNVLPNLGNINISEF